MLTALDEARPHFLRQGSYLDPGINRVDLAMSKACGGFRQAGTKYVLL